MSALIRAGLCQGLAALWIDKMCSSAGRAGNPLKAVATVHV